MRNAIEQFGNAIRAAGLDAPEIIHADGKMHRFASNGKRGDDAGWYVIHEDGIPAGSFGCWRTGLSQPWRADIGRTLSPSEEQAHKARVEAMRKQRESEEAQRKTEAANKAAAIWGNAKQAPPDHPYLINKGIKACGARAIDDSLVIPMRADGKLHSLQFIDKYGEKRFLTGGKVSGCYFSIGKPDGAQALCIAEGFATGASIHEATGYPVAVAFNAVNLLSVTNAMRERFPSLMLIVCADDDYRTDGNPGITKASEAAQAVGGRLAIPDFGNGRPEGATDFNDMAAHCGIDAVRGLIQSAQPLPTKGTQSESVGRNVILQCAADIPMVPIRWLWYEWLPAGKLTILAGAAGTGKTTLAMLIAAAITNGGKFPDGTQCLQRGNVLIWSSEDAPDDTIIPRPKASVADLKRCHFITGITENGESVPFDPATDIHELEKAVLKMGGASLLIVDPIVSAVAGDMHRANDVRRSLQALVDFAGRHSCAVLGITHFSKGGAGKSPQDRVIGSQAFAALARMVWVAGKQEDGARRVLARSKTNIAPDDGGFAYSLKQTLLDNGITASHAQWEGAIEGTAREILGDVEHDESGDGSAQGDAESFLRDLLADGPMPTKHIQAEANGAGHSWATIRRAQKRLGVAAYKEKGGMKSQWLWSLPNDAHSRRCSRNPEDAQQNNMSNFAEFEQHRTNTAQEIEVTL